MSIAGMGSWGFESKKDPRWNKKGIGFGSVSTGGPKEMEIWIKECKEKYGEPPDDLEQWFYKDF